MDGFQIIKLKRRRLAYALERAMAENPGCFPRHSAELDFIGPDEHNQYSFGHSAHVTLPKVGGMCAKFAAHIVMAPDRPGRVFWAGLIYSPIFDAWRPFVTGNFDARDLPKPELLVVNDDPIDLPADLSALDAAEPKFISAAMMAKAAKDFLGEDTDDRGPAS